MNNKWCRINEEKGSQIIDLIPVDEELQDLGTFFKIFGDPTRLKILFILKDKELCVHDLSILLDMSQTSVSHQLKVLRHNRLVRYHKEGKMAIYSLSDSHINEILKTGLEHIKELNL